MQANPRRMMLLVDARGVILDACHYARGTTPERRAPGCRWFWALSAYALRTKGFKVPARQRFDPWWTVDSQHATFGLGPGR